MRTFAEKQPQPPTMATATQAPPEVYGAQSDQHPGEDRGFLPQHDGSRVIETSAGRREGLPVYHPPREPHPSEHLLLAYYQPFLEEGGIFFLLTPQLWIFSLPQTGAHWG